MDYKVVLTVDAVNDLEKRIKYLIEEKKSKQAAQAVLNDFEETKERLKNVAFRPAIFLLGFVFLTKRPFAFSIICRLNIEIKNSLSFERELF